MLGDVRFASLFAPGSRAEVPIVGRIPHKGRIVAVSGQVDRLVVTASEILIADYKTNRSPPQHVEDAPNAYKAQLALYRAVLAKLYPQRPVRAALIWTEALDLMEISSSALDDALGFIEVP
jgi:ATP-dependent helicase/nuclease subunit A